MSKKRAIVLLKTSIFYLIVFALFLGAAMNMNLFGINSLYKDKFYFAQQVDSKIFSKSELMYWFEVLNILGKELQIYDVDFAVLNARIANLFLELEDKKIETSEKNVVLYRFMLKFYPHSQLFLEESLRNVGLENKTLSKEALAVLNQHVKKYENELQNVYLENNKYKESGKWKLIKRVGEPQKPISPGSFRYEKSKYLSRFDYFLAAPKYNFSKFYLDKQVNILKTNMASQQNWMERILYWNAGPGSLGLPYIFQKQLFKENCGATVSYDCPPNFLNTQIEFANLVSDAYILVNENKYKFQTLRPEQVVQNYVNNIRTPKIPGFPSTHAALCTLAKNFLIDDNLLDECINSRLYSGVEFEEDVFGGVELGEKIKNI